MALTCNIDARGKRARLIYGIMLIAIGLVAALFWAGPSGEMVAWIIAAIAFALGGFCVFEARAGWCALRAMGIRTRV